MILDCPLPKLDFDLITLGHGSGGLLTHRLLDAGVFSLFDNEYLRDRPDGAVLLGVGDAVFTTDSYVVSPISFPGGDIGELAVNGTVNDIAMSGGIPKFLSLSFILEEGLSMEEFWHILVSIKYSADQAGVQVVTGDTKVVERGKADKLYINTSGIGTLHPKSAISVKRICKGDKIILSGEMANHGMAIMSKREGLEFESEIKSDTRPLNQMTTALLNEFGAHIKLFRDPTRGGVATVLTEIAQLTGLGMDLFENKLPVNEQVEGACEMLGLDPLYVANEGIFLTIVEPHHAHEVVNKLKTMSNGKHAAVIGEVTSEHPAKAIIHNALGGSRVLHMLPGDQLPRIC